MTAPVLSPSSEPRITRRTAVQTVSAFVALTKPRVIELLLITTAPVMFLAARGIPDVWLILATLIGGAASAGSANAFNQYLDRDIDRLMNRTERRPLVNGTISDRAALTFAWVLGAASIGWLALTTNLVAAALSLAAILSYVVGYTMLLKRRTEQNIVWGGIAGCFPVLIGWAAVTGRVDPAAIVLFVVVFVWTPPHYWPLSMRYREDYDRAGVPMLATTRAERVVGTQTVLYAWATIAASLLLIPIAPMGPLYLVVAVGAGAWFIAESHRMHKASMEGRDPRPMRVFHASISYLTLLFVAVGVDPLLGITLF